MRRWCFAGSSISSGAQHDLMKPSRSTCESSPSYVWPYSFLMVRGSGGLAPLRSRERIPAEDSELAFRGAWSRPGRRDPGGGGHGGRQGGDTAVNTGNTPPESKGRDPDAMRVQAAASSHGRPAETKRGPRLPTSSVSNAMGMTNVPAAATMEKAALRRCAGLGCKGCKAGRLPADWRGGRNAQDRFA